MAGTVVSTPFDGDSVEPAIQVAVPAPQTPSAASVDAQDGSDGNEQTQGQAQYDDDPLDRPVKRGPGRPKGVPGPKYFPATPIYKFNSDNKKAEYQPHGFLNYWKRVAKEPDLYVRLSVYVYRMWPVIDRERDKGADGKPVKNKAIEGPLSDPFETLDEVYQRYGSGDYYFMLSDSGIPNKPETRKTICICYLSGIRDFDTFPPVLDIGDLVLEDPKNRSYIEWRKRKGLPIPGVRSDQEEQDDMSNNAVQQLTGALGDVTNKLVEMAGKTSRESATPIQPAPPATDSAAVNVMAQAAASAIDMMAGAANRATAAQTAQGDPVANFTRMTAAIRELIPPPPPPPDNSAVLAILTGLQADNSRLQEQMAREKDERMAQLQTQLNQILMAQSGRNAAGDLVPVAGNPGGNGSGGGDTLAKLRELKAVQDEMKGLLGLGKGKRGGSGDGDEDEDGETEKPEPWYMKLLPVGLTLLPFIVQSVSTALHNQAVAATGKGNPEPPPQVPPEVAQGLPGGPGGVPGGLPMGMPVQGANGQPVQPGQNQNGGNGNVIPNAEMIAEARRLVAVVSGPMRASIVREESGADLAAWLQEGNPQDYAKIRMAGVDSTLQAIQAFDGELFTMLQSMGPQRAQQYVVDFFTYDPNQDQGQEGEGEVGKGTGTGTGTGSGGVITPR